ncbi:hypothetical protein [Nostoc sp.]|uniref:hypothetical protein n=1 Tax=Nostoc sp. TaxID=1180 RepID=UPI0035944E17
MKKPTGGDRSDFKFWMQESSIQNPKFGERRDILENCGCGIRNYALLSRSLILRDRHRMRL